MFIIAPQIEVSGEVVGENVAFVAESLNTEAVSYTHLDVYKRQAYYRAHARSMREDYAGAAEDYEAAAENGQFREESLFSAAQCRYFAGDYAKAVQGFEQCVEEEIDLAQSWYYLGLSLLALGENERAAEALDKALAAGGTNG